MAEPKHDQQSLYPASGPNEFYIYTIWSIVCQHCSSASSCGGQDHVHFGGLYKIGLIVFKCMLSVKFTTALGHHANIIDIASAKWKWKQFAVHTFNSAALFIPQRTPEELPCDLQGCSTCFCCLYTCDSIHE